jgi:asparagine synthase (glutamine-hydrolysing)
MCGIAGIYNLNHSTPQLQLLESMGNEIEHRGPDYAGYYSNKDGIGFCHRRLSIIDLSERGNQPMANDDKSIWLVYNGEVYNYMELRGELEKKGYSFRSKTDTEVVLKAYMEYGIDCVTLFNGMFAFTIWDSKNKRLFAARDKIGIKPFYYYYLENKVFVFASEIKSLLKHPDISKTPNDNAISNYLLFSYQTDDQTWFQNILSLTPGSYIVIEKGKLNKIKYWDINYKIDYSRSFNSFKDELRETIINSVKSHWQSDVPVGAHLSGGVDSSTIVSVASSYLTNDLHTFSSTFDVGKEFDERKEIGIVTQKFKTHHHQISIDSDDLKTNLAKIIYYLDEPVVGPAVLPMFRISELINKKGIKVVNGGQGVDEMFGGYKPYFSLAVHNLLSAYKRFSFPGSELFYLPIYLYRGGTFDRLLDKFKKTGIEYNWINSANVQKKRIEGYEKLRNETNSLKLDQFEKSSYASLRYYLPALLQQEDRMSMAWSVESRVPMLDCRIIDLSLSIPSWYKVSKGMSKAIFREAVRGIVPDQILDNKIKRGYPTPTSIWFSKDLYTHAQTLFSKKMLSSDYVNRTTLLEILKNQKKDISTNISFPLWQSLMLEEWLRINF